MAPTYLQYQSKGLRIPVQEKLTRSLVCPSRKLARMNSHKVHERVVRARIHDQPAVIAHPHSHESCSFGEDLGYLALADDIVRNQESESAFS